MLVLPQLIFLLNNPPEQPVGQDLVNSMAVDGAWYFKDNLESNGWDPYVVLREYNSGHAEWDLNDGVYATADYVWDAVIDCMGGSGN